MPMLICGVLLWALIHLIPSVAPGVKAAWQGRLGAGGYKASFALLIATGLALIIFGWRSAQPEHLYLLPMGARHGAMLLVLLAFILMGAAQYPTRIKRVVRHPQLTGVLVWAIAHLLMNGDSRSVVLFGGLAIWSVLEIVFINRRDGAWVKPEVPGWGREARGLLISFVVFGVVVFLHPYIAGMPVR